VEAPRLDLPSVLTPPRHEALTAPSDAAIELVRLVGRLQEENRFLAGQVGFLQAQVDQAREAPGLLPATTGGHATQASPQDETRASRANGAAPAVSPPTGAPGQVLVDATELEELRRIREEYETETERLDQELARVQALMEELEEEDVAASHTEPPAESANSAPPPAPSSPHEPPKPTRPWWRAW